MKYSILKGLIVLIVLSIIVSMCVSQQEQQRQALPTAGIGLPAFPGAEGFGSQTIGGRGGQVIKVTNLNDSGAGSFRAAVTSAGARIVVFDVGGTITLSSVLKISNPYITIAGQTAPGDGILIRGVSDPDAINGGEGTIEIRTHDVIIRGLRIRGVNRSAIALYSYPSGSVYNVIIDHNSLSWSVDTILSVWYNPHDVTFSWNIISEPVGSHNYGILIGGYDACETPGYNISIHHNLLSQNNARSPLIKQKIGSPEVINNVVYNYWWQGTTTFSTAAIIGNHYIVGKNTRADASSIGVQNGGECPSLQPASVYVSHNIGKGRTTDTGDDWNIVFGSSTYRTNSPPFALSGITVDAVMDVKAKVLAGAGAIIPSRDSVDVRVVNDVKNGTGGYLVSSPNEVGGWPTLNSGTTPTDSDNDGMPDTWEQTHGGNLNANGYAPSGYTWIEEYVNSPFTTATNTPVPATQTPQIPTNTRTPTSTFTQTIVPLTFTVTWTSIPPTNTVTQVPATKTFTPIPPSVTNTVTVFTPTNTKVPVTPTATPPPAYDRCDYNKDGRISGWSEWICKIFGR
jgi:hypothetical protein